MSGGIFILFLLHNPPPRLFFSSAVQHIRTNIFPGSFYNIWNWEEDNHELLVTAEERLGSDAVTQMPLMPTCFLNPAIDRLPFSISQYLTAHQFYFCEASHGAANIPTSGKTLNVVGEINLKYTRGGRVSAPAPIKAHSDACPRTLPRLWVINQAIILELCFKEVP